MGVYKRPSSDNWYVRFQHEGKDIIRTAGEGATKEDAEKLLTRLKKEYRARKLGIVIDANLDDKLADWVELGDKNRAEPGKVFGLKPSAWTRYKVSINQISRFTEGAMISHVGKPWIANFVENRQFEGVTNRTIRRDLDALSAFFQWLEGKGFIEHNRVRDYDIANIPELKIEIRVPSVLEIQIIIHAKIADDLARWDLVMMGERKPEIGREQFDVRFSFDKCGSFLDSREAQARSRKLFAEIRRGPVRPLADAEKIRLGIIA